MGSCSLGGAEHEVIFASVNSAGGMWVLLERIEQSGRVVLEPRSVLLPSDFDISVFTRLALTFNEDIERSEVYPDLSPLPL